MKINRKALFAFVALASQPTSAFTVYNPGNKVSCRSHVKQSRLAMAHGIPTPPAGKLPKDEKVLSAQEKWRRKAYDDWRAEFGKGDFDPVRYENFKVNYIKVMDANAAAFAAASTKGVADPEPQKLNEYGDCSEEEYTAFSSQKQPEPSLERSNGDYQESSETAYWQQQAGGLNISEASTSGEKSIHSFSGTARQQSSQNEPNPRSFSGTPAPQEEQLSGNENVLGTQDKWRRKAYDDWRVEFGKGEFDPARYENFKVNYAAIMDANAAAAAEASAKGESAPDPKRLNEYGDFSMEEYELMLSNQGQAKSSSTSNWEQQNGEVNGLNNGSVDSTSEESSGNNFGQGDGKNQFHVNTMASTDEVTDTHRETPKDGKDSRLESDLKLPSTSPQGSKCVESEEDESEGAREAYQEWCELHGKEPGVSRFRIFRANFLRAKAFSKKNGRSVSLNQYADCTAEEYEMIKSNTLSTPAAKEVHPPPTEEIQPPTNGGSVGMSGGLGYLQGLENTLSQPSKREEPNIISKEAEVDSVEEARRRVEEAVLQARMDVERVKTEAEEQAKYQEEEAAITALDQAIQSVEETRLKAEEEVSLVVKNEARIKKEEEAAHIELKAIMMEDEARLNAAEEARQKMIAQIKAEEAKAKEEAEMREKDIAEFKLKEEQMRRAEMTKSLGAEDMVSLASKYAQLRSNVEAWKQRDEAAKIKAENNHQLRAEEGRAIAEEEARMKARLDEAVARMESIVEARQLIQEHRIEAEDEVRRHVEEVARLKAEVTARRKLNDEANAKAEEARLKAEEDSRRQAEEQARLKAEAEARIKAEEEAQRQAEEEARIKAEEESKRREEEARIKAEEESKRKEEEEAKRKEEEEARIKAEEESKRKEEEEAKVKAAQEARIKAEEESKRKEEEEAKVKAEEEARIKAEEEAKSQEEATLKARKRQGEDKAKMGAVKEASDESVDERRIILEACTEEQIRSDKLIYAMVGGKRIIMPKPDDWYGCMFCGFSSESSKELFAHWENCEDYWKKKHWLQDDTRYQEAEEIMVAKSENNPYNKSSGGDEKQQEDKQEDKLEKLSP